MYQGRRRTDRGRVFLEVFLGFVGTSIALVIASLVFTAIVGVDEAQLEDGVGEFALTVGLSFIAIIVVLILLVPVLVGYLVGPNVGRVIFLVLAGGSVAIVALFTAFFLVDEFALGFPYLAGLIGVGVTWFRTHRAALGSESLPPVFPTPPPQDVVRDVPNRQGPPSPGSAPESGGLAPYTPPPDDPFHR